MQFAIMIMIKELTVLNPMYVVQWPLASPDVDQNTYSVPSDIVQISPVTKNTHSRVQKPVLQINKIKLAQLWI